MDAYDASQIDNTVVDENFLEGLRNRQLADEEMDARDERFRQARVAGELDEYEREGLGGIEEEDLSSESESEDEEDEEEGYPSERSLNLDAYDCPLQEWITETRTRNEIKKRFRKFLNTYYEGIEMRKQWERQHKDEEDRGPCPYKKSREIYPGKIRNMCARNSASLEVSYGHLGEMQSLSAIWLTDVPKDMLQIFDEVLKELIMSAKAWRPTQTKFIIFFRRRLQLGVLRDCSRQLELPQFLCEQLCCHWKVSRVPGFAEIPAS